MGDIVTYRSHHNYECSDCKKSLNTYIYIYWYHKNVNHYLQHTIMSDSVQVTQRDVCGKVYIYICSLSLASRHG
jgi:hypothetical protein